MCYLPSNVDIAIALNCACTSDDGSAKCCHVYPHTIFISVVEMNTKFLKMTLTLVEITAPVKMRNWRPEQHLPCPK